MHAGQGAQGGRVCCSHGVCCQAFVRTPSVALGIVNWCQASVGERPPAQHYTALASCIVNTRCLCRYDVKNDKVMYTFTQVPCHCTGPTVRMGAVFRPPIPTQAETDLAGLHKHVHRASPCSTT